jgi:phosphoribosylformimino-5-aminoimidazole carboxamide ribotide isomerase
LKIIPVIDILNGIAVHAVKGRREEYKPLKSILCDSTDPVVVASAFKNCGFEELYIADLDAILKKTESFHVFLQIVENTDLRLLVDAGISDFERLKLFLKSKVSKVIVGTETLRNIDFVADAIDSFGGERVIASLDMKNGKVLTNYCPPQLVTPLEFARKLQSRGVIELILLDLARVGSKEGVDFALIKEMVRSLQAKVFVGGGVRNVTDLLALKNIGVYGVLLGTSLHSGAISIEELKRLNLV